MLIDEVNENTGKIWKGHPVTTGKRSRDKKEDGKMSKMKKTGKGSQKLANLTLVRSRNSREKEKR